jgi:hypothetical protein
MTQRGSLLEHLKRAREKHTAVPGLWIDSFLEAEALKEFNDEPGDVTLFMVSSERKNLKVFIKSLRCFDSGQVFVQLVGEEPAKLALMASERDVDAVYLKTAMPEAARILCERVGRQDVVTEVLLPWKRAEPGGSSEGRVVDEEKARLS